MHVSQMKGKCTPTELALQRPVNGAPQAPRDLRAVLNPRSSRPRTNTGSSNAGTSNVAGKGTISTTASKSTRAGNTSNKTKSGRVTKPTPAGKSGKATKTTSAKPARNWRKLPPDTELNWPCAACDRRFQSPTARAKHLYQNMRPKDCLIKILQSQELQAGLFLITKAGDPPTVGGLRFKIGCPWCSCAYELPSSLRAHMREHHNERYVNVIWVEANEGDGPGVIKLCWVPTPVQETNQQADNEGEDEDEGKNEDDDDDDGDYEPHHRMRSASKARRARRIILDDDEDSDMPLVPAIRNKRRTAKTSKSRSSNKRASIGLSLASLALKTPVLPQGIEQAPVQQPQVPQAHTCPFCNVGFGTTIDVGNHLRICLASSIAPGPSVPPPSAPAPEVIPAPVIQPVSHASDVVAAEARVSGHICMEKGCTQLVMPGLELCRGCDALYLYKMRVRAEKSQGLAQ